MFGGLVGWLLLEDLGWPQLLLLARFALLFWALIVVARHVIGLGQLEYLIDKFIVVRLDPPSGETPLTKSAIQLHKGGILEQAVRPPAIINPRKLRDE